MDRNSTKSSQLIYKYYRAWTKMVNNIDYMLKETLKNTSPNEHNKKVLENLHRRQLMFEDVRTKFDVEVKFQLEARGPEAGSAVLEWAKAELLRKLNEAIKFQESCKRLDSLSVKRVQQSCNNSQSESDQQKHNQFEPESDQQNSHSVVPVESECSTCCDTDIQQSSVNMRSPNGSLYKKPKNKRRKSRKDQQNELKSRLEHRKEFWRKKRDEFRKQRLLHTHPMPLTLSASDRARITKRLSFIKKRAQETINAKSSIGTIRKIIGNVGANQEKVAELSRSMIRNGKNCSCRDCG